MGRPANNVIQATFSDPTNGTNSSLFTAKLTCVTAAVLYHGWSCPIAGCDTSTYNATGPTNVGGVFPFLDGDLESCMVWKLAATVCNTEPTFVPSSTSSFYCPTSGGFVDPYFGAFCAVNDQYSCADCTAQCSAGACLLGPYSLRNCSGTESNQNMIAAPVQPPMINTFVSSASMTINGSRPFIVTYTPSSTIFGTAPGVLSCAVRICATYGGACATASQLITGALLPYAFCFS